VNNADFKPMSIIFEDLGRIPYAEALALQRARHGALVAAREGGGAPMTVFLLEHDPPVITMTRRPGVTAHLLATPEVLAGHGVELVDTDRGGDITYHGPGQLVAYPILDLNVLGLRIHPYMRLLEDVVIRTLASFGVVAGREAGATGVWVVSQDGTARKIAALGVRLSRWCSMHGLAINVDPDLSHFDLIIPCGLAGRQVTSLRRELGDACPSIEEVKGTITEEFRNALEPVQASE
jgi:lipoyl(octanoyl) transferase